MNYLLSIVLLAIGVSFLGDKEIVLSPNWKKGDAQKLLVKKGHKDYLDGELYLESVMVHEVLLTIIEQTDTSYIIEWAMSNRHKEAQKTRATMGTNPWRESLNEILGELTLQYRTDELGSYEELVNIDSTYAQIEEEWLAVLKQKMKLREDSKLPKNLFIEELARTTEEISLYHAFLGKPIHIDTSYNYKDKFATKLGPNILPVNVTLTTKMEEAEKQLLVEEVRKANMTIESLPIPKLQDSASEKEKESWNKLIEGFRLNGMKIEEIKTHKYDYESAYLKHFSHRKIFSSKLEKSEDFLVIESVEHKVK